MRSIIQKAKECYLCRHLYYQINTKNLEEHHIIYGTGSRQVSERLGLKVWLCHEHHQGDKGVHYNPELRYMLCKIAQVKYEARHSHQEWMVEIGRNYLDDK